MRPTLFNYLTTREEFQKYTAELFEMVVEESLKVTENFCKVTENFLKV